MGGRRRILVTSATGALSSASAPVGGGVAVLEGLLPLLAARPGVEVHLVRPRGAGPAPPPPAGVVAHDLPVPSLARAPAERLLALGARPYARFAVEWERALDAFFEDVSPEAAVVVANDVSEGPPFARLAARGFEQVVLYHVVVGDFFARRYLPGLPAPLAARTWRGARRVGLERLLPSGALVRLVWPKEEAAARHAAAVVPSPGLARALAALYPGSGVARRTHVVPWGVLGPTEPGLRERRDETLAAHGLSPERFTLLTLSRLSPEKRIDLALDALARLEREAPARAERLALAVVGGPAYMGGERTRRRLERRAARLSRVAVRFPGYVGAEAKRALLAAADLLVSASSYEAYGLSIAQALAAGTPVLATPHDGARAIVEPGLGWIEPASPAALARRLAAVAGADLGPYRERAAAWGRAHRFADAVRPLLELLAPLRTGPGGAW